MSPNFPGNILRGPRLGQCLSELPRRLQFIVESNAQIIIKLTTYRSYSDFWFLFYHIHLPNITAGTTVLIALGELIAFVLVPLAGLFATLSIVFGLISITQGVCLSPHPPVTSKTL